MKKQMWIARGGLVAVLAVFAVGCGSGLKGGSNASSNGAQSVNVDDTIARVQAATADAQKAMADANAAIASISDSNGNIKIDLFATNGSAPVESQGLLAPLIAKLQPIFDTVYNKVLFVKQQFDSAKGMLTDALSKLPANDPQVALLTQQLAQVTQLETQFEGQIHDLAGKLSYAITGLDQLVNMATSFIPIPGVGAIAGTLIDMFLLDDVKNLILDLQTKLLAL